MDNTTTENIMSASQTISNSADTSTYRNTSIPGSAIKFMTIAVVFMLSSFHAAKLMRPGHPMEVIPYAIGCMLGPVIVTVVVFFIFQIFKKFRTARARWLIVFWVNAVLLFSTFAASLQKLSVLSD